MSGQEADEDTIDIELRPAETVARRCLILATILQRFTIDANPQDDPEGSIFDLREWLREEHLWEDATERERAFFLRNSDDLESPGGVDITPTAESLVTLGWALGLHDLPAEDWIAALPDLIRQIPSPWERTGSWISTQSLRREPEIARMREAAEVWHWRLDIEPERRTTKDRELRDIEATIQVVTQEAVAANLLAPGKHGGFTLAGTPVTAMSPDELAERQLFTRERLITLNWICGFGSAWDNVPLDV